MDDTGIKAFVLGIILGAGLMLGGIYCAAQAEMPNLIKDDMTVCVHAGATKERAFDEFSKRYGV